MMRLTGRATMQDLPPLFFAATLLAAALPVQFFRWGFLTGLSD
jgi:hypothetical protein